MTNTIFQLSAIADALFNNLSTLDIVESSYTPSYPKTNIYVTKNDDIVIESAVPGFKKEDISVTVEGNILKIKATKSEEEDDSNRYLSRQLAKRNFENSYTLSPRLDKEKTRVTHNDGLLVVTIPLKEEEKAKTFSVPIN